MTTVSYVFLAIFGFPVENGNTLDSGCTGRGESEGGGVGRSRGTGMEDSRRDCLMHPALGSLLSSSGALSISCQTRTHARRVHHGAGTRNTNNVRTFKVSQHQFLRVIHFLGIFENSAAFRPTSKGDRKFIIRQPPIGEKDDYDSENSWISDGLPSSSRRRRSEVGGARRYKANYRGIEGEHWAQCARVRR